MPPRKRKARGPDAGALSAAMLDAVTCPITSELVVCPVVAADGHVYERDAIAKWLRTKKTSPRTNKAMGTQLVDSPARSMVMTLIEAGGIDDKKTIGSWHLATARAMARGALPGGMEMARDHLKRGVAATGKLSAADKLLIEAFALLDKRREILAQADAETQALLARADADDRADLSQILGAVDKQGPAPMLAWREDVVVGSAVVKIIDDVEELQRLCKRPALGADAGVGYSEPMKKLCGKYFVINGIHTSRRAYSIKQDSRWVVPFDACVLIQAS